MPTVQLADCLTDEVLNCKVCNRRARQPVLLNCLHSICADCAEVSTDCPHCGGSLVRVLDENNPDGDGVGNIKELQSNPFVTSLQSIAECYSENDKVCDYCQFENRQQNARSRCLECGDNMCADCGAAHARTKITRHHTQLTFKEICTGNYDEFMREVQVCSCAIHPTERVRQFCSTCESPVCRECIDCGSHDSHDTETVKVIGPKIKSRINGLLEGVKKKMPHLEEHQKFLDEYKIELIEKRVSLTQEIEAQAALLHDLIEKHKNHLFQQLREAVEAEQTILEGKRIKLLKTVNKLDQSSKFVDIILLHGRQEEMLAVSKTIQTRLSHLLYMQTEHVSGKLDLSFQQGGATERGIDHLFGRLSLSHNQIQNSDREDDPINESIIMECSQTLEALVKADNEEKTKELLTLQSFKPPEIQVNHIEPSPPSPKLEEQFNALTQHQNLLLSPRSVSAAPHSSHLLNRAELILEFEAKSPMDSRDIWPTGLHIHPNGDFYVLDRDNKVVKVFDCSGNFKFDFGGPGSGDGTLASPYDLTLIDGRLVLVTDYQHEEVKVFSATGQYLKCHKGHFKHPRGICGSGTTLGHYVVVDCRLRNITIHKVDNGDIVRTIQGGSGLSNSLSASMSSLYNYNTSPTSPRGSGSVLDQQQNLVDPYYITVTADRRIVVTDWAAPNLKFFDYDGRWITSFGSYGLADHQMLQPYGIASDQFGNIMVADNANHRVHLLSSDGQFIKYLVSKFDGLWHPMAIAVAPSGIVAVSEALGKIKVFKYI